MGKTLKPEEISLFCTQIEYVLKVGIPISEGISIILEDIDKGILKDTFMSIDEKIKTGETLVYSMNEAGVFPDYVINMVGIGEASGKTEEVMNSLAGYYEREKTLRAKLQSSVLNPIFLFVMMGAVVLLLITKVMPMFINIFNQLGGSISAQASAAIDFGVIAAVVALVIILILVVVIIIFAIMSRTESGSVITGKFLSKFPLTKKLMAKMAARNFSSSMHLMLSSGLEIHESLLLASDIVGNKYLKQRIMVSYERVVNGEPFVSAIEQSNIFSGIFTSMINVGFKTGSIDDVMKKLSDVYEEEINASLNRIASIIEPLLVGILSVIIGAILIAVMLPLVGILSTIG